MDGVRLDLWLGLCGIAPLRYVTDGVPPELYILDRKRTWTGYLLRKVSSGPQRCLRNSDMRLSSSVSVVQIWGSGSFKFELKFEQLKMVHITRPLSVSKQFQARYGSMVSCSSVNNDWIMLKLTQPWENA